MSVIIACRLCGVPWSKHRITPDCLCCMMQYGLKHTKQEIQEKTPNIFQYWEQAVSEAAEKEQKLRDTQTELEATQAKLKATQAELEATQAKLTYVRATHKKPFQISDTNTN